MSLLTKCIGLAKKAKHRYQDSIQAHQPVYLSPVRRIDRVAAHERICAMTFDDGPCRLPANPDSFGGKPLTLHLAELLEKYDAKGTFDVVGDTSENYPDAAGAAGSASWGGIAYDHYPDFQKDQEGGVAHCPELIDRLLAGGHQITSHSWRHIIWGRKNVVYGKRRHMPGLDAVMEDLEKLDRVMKERWDYSIRLSRPPHYVDRIPGGFTSYDAYALMGYQYLGASFDGAGWLPLSGYEVEVAATIQPMEKLLDANPDGLCGQIIFQKDGFNMARRSPVADGLEKQLQLLTRLGYRVVTVDALLAHSPFSDITPDKADAQHAALLLAAGWCVAFRDNTLRPQTILTRGGLAQMAYGWEGAKKRVALIREKARPFSDLKASHPYAGACVIAAERCGLGEGRRFLPDAPATRADLRRVLTDRFGEAPEVIPEEPLTHSAFFALAAELTGERHESE